MKLHIFSKLDDFLPFVITVLDRRPKFYGRSRRFKTYGYGYGGRSLRPFLGPKVFWKFSYFFFSKIEAKMCSLLHRCHKINVDYDSIKLKQTLFNEIPVKLSYLVGMFAVQNFYDLFICWFFILRLRLRPTAKGRSLSGPNIRLRP